MLIEEYQDIAMLTSVYPKVTRTLPGSTDLDIMPVYPAMAMCGEAGELAEKVEASWHSGALDQPGAVRELGDVLWYVTATARDVGLTLTELAGGCATFRGVTDCLILDDSVNHRWIVGQVNTRPAFASLRLHASAARVAERVKKAWRDEVPLDLLALTTELQLVLISLAYAALLIDSSLDAVAVENIRKLADRRARGVLAGAGDNR